MFALQCFGTGVFVCFALGGSKAWVRESLVWLSWNKCPNMNHWVFPSVSPWVLECLNPGVLQCLSPWVLESRRLWILDSLNPWLRVWQLVFLCWALAKYSPLLTPSLLLGVTLFSTLNSGGEGGGPSRTPKTWLSFQLVTCKILSVNSKTLSENPYWEGVGFWIQAAVNTRSTHSQHTVNTQSTHSQHW